MTEDEADQEATRRNFELGSQGRTQDYWMPVQREDGEWDVELRRAAPKKGSWLEQLIDGILTAWR